MIAMSLLFLLSLPFLGNCAAVTTVTLVGLRPTGANFTDFGTPLPTATYSAAGVNSEGLTTYIEMLKLSQVYEVEEVTVGVTTRSNGATEELYSYSTSTSTFPVQTHLATLVAGASEYKYIYQYDSDVLSWETENDCHWDENGKGECEAEAWDPKDTFRATFTSTYSGTIHPVYTLVVSDTIPGQPSATSTSFGVQRTLVGIPTIVTVLAFSVFFVLSSI